VCAEAFQLLRGRASPQLRGSIGGTEWVLSAKWKAVLRFCCRCKLERYLMPKHRYWVCWIFHFGCYTDRCTANLISVHNGFAAPVLSLCRIWSVVRLNLLKPSGNFTYHQV
jgi:hypothetical protein